MLRMQTSKKRPIQLIDLDKKNQYISKKWREIYESTNKESRNKKQKKNRTLFRNDYFNASRFVVFFGILTDDRPRRMVGQRLRAL